MPRTKVSKTSKRNREVQVREEKVRQFENALNDYINRIESKKQSFIEDWENEMKLLKQRIKGDLLQMKMGDIFKMQLATFTSNVSPHNSVTDTTVSTLSQSIKITKNHDEGYLAQENSHSSSGSSITQKDILNSAHRRLRTPGPLNSAISRKTRRSRSACNEYVPRTTRNQLKQKSSEGHTSNDDGTRKSRSKLRTPQTGHRSKTHSVDRACYTEAHFNSPPAAVMRWPKPGELIMSSCGTPVLAQIMPDNYANLYIPFRDGLLSLRPKKVADLQTDILKDIDPETLDQLKTLNTNIDKLVNMAYNIKRECNNEKKGKNKK